MAAGTFLPCTKVLKYPFGRKKVDDPKTLGDRLLNRRLDKGLLQWEVAELLFVSEDTVTYWETGRTQPQVRHYPAIIAFLGYYPFDHETESVGGKLTQIRNCYGLSLQQCANRLAVSFEAARRWERGSPVMSGKVRLLIEKIWNALDSSTLT